MWIKICANTTLEDTLLAADAGADAVGFVFAPSPRRVTAGHVATMMPDLPADLTKIGIFNTHDSDEIAFSLQSAGLHGVQLHGELDFSLAEKLRQQFDSSFFLIQTLHWDLNSDPARAEDRLRHELRAVARHDERLKPLAELVVLHADHGGLLDLLVVGEQVLDLAREHVLAT